MKKYDLYQDGEKIYTGTLDEISNYTRLKKQTLFYYKTPKYLEKNKNNGALKLSECDVK